MTGHLDPADDSDLEEIIRARNEEGWDPVKVQEELQSLLENIRPDEDIPTEQLSQPPELKCQLHQHQKKGLAWLVQQEEGSNKGGILGKWSLKLYRAPYIS